MFLRLSPNLASHFGMIPDSHFSFSTGNGVSGKPAGEKKKNGSRFGDPFLKPYWCMVTTWFDYNKINKPNGFSLSTSNFEGVWNLCAG
jgi:hypothetical protein